MMISLTMKILRNQRKAILSLKKKIAATTFYYRRSMLLLNFFMRWKLKTPPNDWVFVNKWNPNCLETFCI